MESSVVSDSILAQPATGSSSTEFALPESSWDEVRLLAYMQQHDKAIGGLERSSLQHEYCFGAAAQLKYEQLDGKWTAWAKAHRYPKETFRRRRLLFVRAGSLQDLGEYTSKMEAYYDLGIYRRPKFEDLDALDAAPSSAPGISGPAEGVVEPDLAVAETVPPALPTVAALNPSEDGGERKPVDERPKEAVLRGLEDRYADAVEALLVQLPLVCWKLLDRLAFQEEAGQDQVIARAVREYWLRNGDPARFAAPRAGEVSA